MTTLVLCRKCNFPIVQSVSFGSPETGWEHMPGDCGPEGLYEPGTPFICHCVCHLPIGCVLMPGKAPPPSMKPCSLCAPIHP